MSSSEEYNRIIQEILLPRGFKFEQDFVLVNEQLIYGVGDRVTDLLNQEIHLTLAIARFSPEMSHLELEPKSTLLLAQTSQS